MIKKCWSIGASACWARSSWSRSSWASWAWPWIKRKLQTKTKHDVILKSLINWREATNHFCFLGGYFWICSILTKQKTWYSTACHPWNQLKIYCSTRWCCLQTIIATLARCQTSLQVTNLLQTSEPTSKHGTAIRSISNYPNVSKCYQSKVHNLQLHHLHALQPNAPCIFVACYSMSSKLGATGRSQGLLPCRRIAKSGQTSLRCSDGQKHGRPYLSIHCAGCPKSAKSNHSRTISWRYDSKNHERMSLSYFFPWNQSETFVIGMQKLILTPRIFLPPAAERFPAFLLAFLIGGSGGCRGPAPEPLQLSQASAKTSCKLLLSGR